MTDTRVIESLSRLAKAAERIADAAERCAQSTHPAEGTETAPGSHIVDRDGSTLR